MEPEACPSCVGSDNTLSCLALTAQELVRSDILPGGVLDNPSTWTPPALQLAPGFQAPLPSSFEGLKEYIETALPEESPVMYGMHPNAGVLLSTSLGETLFKTITEVSGGAAGGLSVALPPCGPGVAAARAPANTPVATWGCQRGDHVHMHMCFGT